MINKLAKKKYVYAFIYTICIIYICNILDIAYLDIAYLDTQRDMNHFRYVHMALPAIRLMGRLMFSILLKSMRCMEKTHLE